MRTLASTVTKDYVKKDAKEVFVDTIFHTAPTVDAKLRSRINDWLVHFENQGSSANVVLAKQLLEEVLSISPL